MIAAQPGLFLEEALACFDFGGEVTKAQRFGRGHINDTFLVSAQQPDGGVRRFVLQRINAHVFRDIDGLMQNILRVTAHLRGIIRAEGGDPARQTLTVLPAKDGAPYCRTPDQNAWRAYLFIEDTVCYQVAESPALFRAAASAFGRFTGMLEGYPAETLQVTIPHFHDTRVRLQNFLQALERDALGRAAECEAEIAFALARQKDCPVLMDLLDAGKLPLRVTHNDTKLNNILMDPITQEAVCIIDLDTVMPGLALHDYGDAIRYGANTATEDEKDAAVVSFSLPLFETYTAGYLESAGPAMTPLEKEMMPWGAKLMTLELGLRFLTDFLEGDIYFKAKHPGHNLQRCRTQLKLVGDMEQVWEEMFAVVRKYTR